MPSRGDTQKHGGIRGMGHSSVAHRYAEIGQMRARTKAGAVEDWTSGEVWGRKGVTSGVSCGTGLMLMSWTKTVFSGGGSLHFLLRWEYYTPLECLESLSARTGGIWKFIYWLGGWLCNSAVKGVTLLLWVKLSGPGQSRASSIKTIITTQLTLLTLTPLPALL